MPTFYSPTGNPEVWDVKPDGYFTPEEWQVLNPPPPPPVPTQEELYYAEVAAVESEYNRPFDGVTGGILTDLQMRISPVILDNELLRDDPAIASLQAEYAAARQQKAQKLAAIDQKYGII